MKRILAAAVLLCFALGCAKTPVEASPAPSASPLPATEAPTTPAPRQAEVLTEYIDIADGVFAIRPDWSGTDYYGGWVYQLTLLSREPIPIDSIGLSAALPDGSLTRLDVHETVFDGIRFGKNQKGADDETGHQLDFTFDQYLCTRGFDWEAFGALYRQERAYWRQGDAEGQETIGDEMYAMTEPYRQAYYALPEEALPHFCAYTLLFDVRTLTDASFDRVLLRIGEQTTEIPVGEVTLLCDAPPWQNDSTELMPLMGNLTFYHADQYYEDGYYPFGVPFLIQVQKDMTLVGLSFAEDELTLVSSHLVLTDPNGMITDLAWDGQSPLDVTAGTMLELELGFLSDRLLQNGTTVKGTVLMDYRAGKQKRSVGVASFEGDWGRSPIEHWLEYTEGIDFETYYREYYRFLTDYERGVGNG